MEKDTVLLSLRDYNELREFKERIKGGCTYTTQYPKTIDNLNGRIRYWDGHTSTGYYTTRDEVVVELLSQNAELVKANEQLAKVSGDLLRDNTYLKARNQDLEAKGNAIKVGWFTTFIKNLYNRICRRFSTK